MMTRKFIDEDKQSRPKNKALEDTHIDVKGSKRVDIQHNFHD